MILENKELDTEENQRMSEEIHGAESGRDESSLIPAKGAEVFETEEHGTWNSVSPTKRGRKMEKLRSKTEVSLVSPSRFSILADT